MKRFLLSSVSMSLLLASCGGSTNITGEVHSNVPPRPGLQSFNQIRIFPFDDKNADGLYQPDEQILSGVRHLISGPGGFAQCYTQGSTLTNVPSNLCYFSENALPNATYGVRLQPVLSSLPNTATVKLPTIAGEVASSDPYSMVLRFSKDQPAHYDVYWPYQFSTALPLEVGQIRGTVKLKSALDNSPFLAPNLAVKFTSGTLVRQVYTDSEGRFALGSLPVGPAQLEVLTADQQPIQKSVMVSTGQWTEVDLEKEIAANWRALDIMACLDNNFDGVCNLSEGRIDPTNPDAPVLDVTVSLQSSKVGYPDTVLKNGASSTGNVHFNFPTAWTVDPLAGSEETTPVVTPPDGIFCKALNIAKSVRTQQDMPCVQAQMIKVQVFEDQNGNTVREDSEPLINNLQFEITTPYGNVAYTPHQQLSLPPGQGSIKLIEDENSKNLVSTALIDSQKLNPGTFLPFYVSPSSANVLSLPYIRVDRSGKLTGYIFEDTNGNGIQESTEQAIPGVQLKAIRSDTRITALKEQYAITDLTGRYIFEKLDEGSAQVIFKDESIGRVGAFGRGFDITAPSTATRLNSRVAATTQIVKGNTSVLNFGLYPKLTKFNVSFYIDANRNGVRNLGERSYDEPLSVNVLSQNSRPNSDGLYARNDFTQQGTFSKGEFIPISSESLKAWIPSELTKGSLYISYSNGMWGVVTGTSQPGWVTNTSAVYPLNLTDYSYPNAYHPFFELKPDVWTSNVPVEIGLALRSVAVSGVVFDDLNANDIYDSGEPILPKATVEQGEKTVETDARGFYSYTSDSASWKVPSVRYYGYSAGEASTRNQVWSDRFIRDVNMLLIKSNKHANIQETLNLPIQLPKVAVSGIVFADANKNGQYDSEPVLPGIPVSITDFSGKVLKTTTNASGLYTFTGVSLGSSVLSVDTRALPGYTPSTSLPAPIDVQWNGANTLDIGFVPPVSVGTIKGMVFDDLNKDNVRNPGEPGISGVKVIAKTSSGMDLTPVFTGVNGAYTFDNVPVGNVTLSLDGGIPTGYVPIAPTSFVVVVSSDKEALGNNFGLRTTLCSISGKIFDDFNGDGNWHVPEKGFPNVEVTLNDAKGNVFTALTDAQGEYSFSGVSEGNVVLSIDLTSRVNSIVLNKYRLTTRNLPMNVLIETGKTNTASSDIGFSLY